MLIIEGTLADVDGVRPGQVGIDNGAIAAVGQKLGASSLILMAGFLF